MGKPAVMLGAYEIARHIRALADEVIANGASLVAAEFGREPLPPMSDGRGVRPRSMRVSLELTYLDPVKKRRARRKPHGKARKPARGRR